MEQKKQERPRITVHEVPRTIDGRRVADVVIPGYGIVTKFLDPSTPISEQLAAEKRAREKARIEYLEKLEKVQESKKSFLDFLKGKDKK